MDAIRDVLRAELRRSLNRMSDEDKLSVAWPVICGQALTQHGRVIGYTEGELEVAVDGAAWLDQFLAMRADIESELARIAGVRMVRIHFLLKGSEQSNERSNYRRRTASRRTGEP